MWQVKIHRLVIADDFKKISKKDQRIILKTIHKKLSIAPEEYGTPLRHNLKNYWKLKISAFRVVYKIEKKKVVVLVLKIGMRRDDEVYKAMLKRLKKA